METNANLDVMHNYCPECRELINENHLLGSRLAKYNVPFICSSCCGLKFPYCAIRDIVFVYPFPAPETVGLIVIPELAKINMEVGIGIILSIGPGYYSKKNKFVACQLKIGDIIVYNKQVPWIHYVLGNDNRKHKVKYMGYEDVLGVYDE